MTAPQAIAAALSAQGITSGRAQARLLRLDPSTWHAVRYTRSPSVGAVAQWCDLAGLRLACVPGEGWVAEPMYDAEGWPVARPETP